MVLLVFRLSLPLVVTAVLGNTFGASIGHFWLAFRLSLSLVTTVALGSLCGSFHFSIVVYLVSYLSGGIG